MGNTQPITPAQSATHSPIHIASMSCPIDHTKTLSEQLAFLECLGEAYFELDQGGRTPQVYKQCAITVFLSNGNEFTGVMTGYDDEALVLAEVAGRHGHAVYILLSSISAVSAMARNNPYLDGDE